MRGVFHSLLVLLTLAGRAGAEVVPRTTARVYRISGVAVSTRDGAPVPFCNVSVQLLPPGWTSPGAANRAGTLPFGPSGLLGSRAQGAPGRGPGGRGNATLPALQEIRADATGRFALELSRAGSYRLSSSSRGFKTQNYDDHEGFYSAIVLTEAAPAFSATIRLVPDSRLEGVVFDEVGDPVASARIVAELVPKIQPGGATQAGEDRPQPIGFATSDDRGHYEMNGLNGGDYRLHVLALPWYAIESRGYRPPLRPGQPPPPPPPEPSMDVVYTSTWFPAAVDERSAQILSLTAGEQRQADFHLTAIPAVHLQVPRLDTPQISPGDSRQRAQRSATIVSLTAGPGFGVTQTMGGDGSWDFGGLAPGRYEVHVPGTGGGQGEVVKLVEVVAGSAPVISLEGAVTPVKTLLAFDGMFEESGPTVEFVNIETGQRVTSFRQQRGRPRRMQDEPPDGSDSPDAGPRSVMLTPHRYNVFVNGGDTYLAGITATGARVQGRTVEIDGSSPALTLHLGSGLAVLSGTAMLATAPSAGAMVLLIPATLGDPGGLAGVTRDQTNTDGSFVLRDVVPGRYILVVIEHGWSVDWRNMSTLARYLTEGTPVELKSGENPRRTLVAVQP